MSDGTEAVADDEVVNRRIPHVWGPTEADAFPSPEAFRPHKANDPTGLSMSREKYRPAKSLARPGDSRPFFVGVLRARKIREIALDVVPDPIEPDDPGHCLIPQLTSAARNERSAIEAAQFLAETCIVAGPFAP